MSPVSHALMGWLISQPASTRKERTLVTGAALAADLDGLSLLFGVDAYHDWHHTIGHNLFFGILVAVMVAFVTRSRMASALALVAFHSHLLTDLLGSGAGWGIPYFWPLSPWQIMLHPPWQWELSSWQNLVITVFCLAVVVFIGIKRRRTIIETISLKADARVVEVIHHRFGKAG